MTEDGPATSFFQGFRPIPLPLNADSTYEAVRWIYMKKLRYKHDEALSGLETCFLFIANLPISVTEQQLQSWLEPFGRITHVVFGSLPETETSCKHASVFFTSEDSIDTVLKAPLGVDCLLEEVAEDIITAKLHEYKKWRSNSRMLSQRVDEVLFRYREKCEREQMQLEYRQSVPDEDGFILVGAKTRRNKKGVFPKIRKRGPLEASEPSLKPKESFYKILSRKQQRKLQQEQQNASFDNERIDP